jgi:hypothetical protein
MGDFEWDGCVYRGSHEPTVGRELWERVQEVLDARHAKKLRVAKHNFAFSGLITCGHCGCALVGEIKKGRYIYYHCTGYKGKYDEPTSVRKCSGENSLNCWAGSTSTTKCSGGCELLSAQATRMRCASTKPLSPVSRLNTTGSRSGSTRCTSISSTAGLVRVSLNGYHPNGAPNRNLREIESR